MSNIKRLDVKAPGDAGSRRQLMVSAIQAIQAHDTAKQADTFARLRWVAPPFPVRCVVKRSGDQWQAFSLELGLAAQADTRIQAQWRLGFMISSFVQDALYGEDREHARALLSRKSPWHIYLLYQLAGLRAIRSLYRWTVNVDWPLDQRMPLTRPATQSGDF